jgi:hypothetical protein
MIVFRAFPLGQFPEIGLRRANMRVMRLAVLLVSVLVAAGTTLVAEDQCGKNSLNGTFGFAGMGLVPQKTENGGLRYDPASQVGMVTYDGQGTVTVSMGVQYQGKTSPFNFSGTYDVNSNCTGKASFKDSAGAETLIWDFVIVHGGQEIETIALRPAQQSRPMYSLTFTQKKR